MLEAIIVLTILSVVAVAAGVGLQSVVRIPGGVDTVLAIDAQVVSALEQKITDARSSFATLAGYADTVTINGKTYTRTVAVSALAAPDGSGATSDYKQITVTIGSRTLSTYVTQP